MTRAAFYAPLKPPSHPVPSGDRTMARALVAALEHTGMEVTLASTLQSRDGAGNRDKQDAIMAAAEAETARLIERGRDAGWQFWITYHNYYKAPDLLGPQVAKALGIPYVLIEATRARKRLSGPWARFAEAAEAATHAADIVFYLTERDAEALRAYARPGQKIVRLQPFLPLDHLPPASPLTGSILSVGMFRTGDKLASYELIARTLSRLRTDDWRLSIAGDGPARGEVQALMAPFDGRVIWLGARDADAMKTAYQNAALMFWPGVNEAFGMAYLEAQAAGVPVVAQDRPGVRDVLAPGIDRPSPEDGAGPLAAQIDQLLTDQSARQTAGRLARTHIAENHLIAPAARTLADALSQVTA